MLPLLHWFESRDAFPILNSETRRAGLIDSFRMFFASLISEMVPAFSQRVSTFQKKEFPWLILFSCCPLPLRPPSSSSSIFTSSSSSLFINPPIPLSTCKHSQESGEKHSPSRAAASHSRAQSIVASGKQQVSTPHHLALSRRVFSRQTTIHSNATRASKTPLNSSTRNKHNDTPR